MLNKKIFTIFFIISLPLLYVIYSKFFEKDEVKNTQIEETEDVE